MDLQDGRQSGKPTDKGFEPKSSSAASGSNGGSSEKSGSYSQGEGAYSQDVHRGLPQSFEAEQGALGSILRDPQGSLNNVVEKLPAEHFYHGAHQQIYTTLLELWNHNKPIDPISVTQTLKDQRLLEKVGGATAITNLFTYVPTAANLEYYLEIIREKYLLREVIKACTECITGCYDSQDEVDQIVDGVEQKIFAVSESRYKDQSFSMKDTVMKVIDDLESLHARRGEISGLPTGFSDFDKMTMGLHAAEMIVVAARPSMGKTALAMNMAEHVACDQGKAVAVFSLEMSSQQLVQRLLCSRARVNLERIRDGFLSERDLNSITATAKELKDAPFFIDDTPSLSILEMRAKARRLKAKEDIQMIVIDYLQLCRSTSRRAQDNRQLEISEVSAGIKALAKELDIPIIVLAQLNRNPEARSGGRPRLSDLRESGSIEQDADVVSLLVRAEYYAEDEEGKEEKENQATLIIAKQRNGPVGDVPLVFLKKYTRFETSARQEEPE